MKNLFIALSLLLAPAISYAEISHDTLCFSSGAAKPINFEMGTYYDSSNNLSWGYVKYQGSKQSIPLVLAESTREKMGEGVPDETTTTWIEIYGKQITGEYQMVSQGTMVPSMVYVNMKSGKKMSFGLNVDAPAEKGGCDWK
jgi:hypothetical protein